MIRPASTIGSAASNAVGQTAGGATEAAKDSSSAVGKDAVKAAADKAK
jgi:hypothetical protein